MANENNTAQHRGVLESIVDRIIAWLLGFPPERCTYTTQGMRIPVSEGLAQIELAADLLKPYSTPLGTILIISPYGRGFPIALQARIHAARGYQVLMVSCRGTFGSGGEFDAFRTDVEDGKAVVEWMRQQPWYTGTFATIGGSYQGYVQWALLCDPPDDLVAAIPVVGPHDFARACWGTGALNLDIVRWADNIAHQEEPLSIWKALKSRWSPRNIDTVFDSVPFARNVRSHIGEGLPWLDDILAKPDISDPYYTPMRLERALERANIPVLIMGGWYDTFITFTMEQYIRLRERGCNVTLTIGPWTHMKSATASKVHLKGYEFIEEHLGGQLPAKRTAVEYFVTGAQVWRQLPTFPPNTKPWTFYLQEGGGLMSKPDSTSSGSSSFKFDPRYPTPSIGGNGLLTGGIVDDSALAERDDVLVFDSTPLEDDVEICGQPIVTLAHATDRPFADIFVRISEVDEQGKSHNVTETFKRLDPTRDSDVAVNLALNYCSHRFARGKRIRVVIAGGCWPQYVRNHGVENSDNNGSEMHPVEHTVHHNTVRSSKVTFPVVSGVETKGQQ